MRYYYDTEFLEDGKTIDLISIGIVAEDGREYYAVNSDLDAQKIINHEWLRENVWPQLPHPEKKPYASLTPKGAYFPGDKPAVPPLDYTDSRVKPRWVIANEVRDFLLDGVGIPELWAWYAAYDHVALAQLWGTMLMLPKDIPMWTNDLRQEQHRQGISERAIPPQGGVQHDALEDARWNKVLHQYLAQADATLHVGPTS